MEYYFSERFLIVLFFCVSVFSPIAVCNFFGEIFIPKYGLASKFGFVLYFITSLLASLLIIAFSVWFIMYIGENVRNRNYEKDPEVFLKSQNIISQSASNVRIIGDNIVEYYVGEEKVVVDVTDKLEN